MKQRANLVIGVGMHTGEDTARFLARGFEVVAIEANPQLVETASETFAEEIRHGQLTIVSAAISDHRGTASFGIADSQTLWSSLAPEFIERNERLARTSYRYVDVDTIPFGDVLDQFGIPYYLKIDIEGMTFTRRSPGARPRFALDRVICTAIRRVARRPALWALLQTMIAPRAGDRSASWLTLRGNDGLRRPAIRLHSCDV